MVSIPQACHQIVSSALHTILVVLSMFMLLSDVQLDRRSVLQHQSTLLFQHVDHTVGDQTVFVTNFCVLLLQEVCDIIYTRVPTRTTYEGIPGYPSLSVDGPY